MKFTKNGYILTFLYALFFWPTYILLAVGPFIYLLRNWSDPSSFLLNYTMVVFTVGMFALLVGQKKDEPYQNFSFIGSMYLLSGALALTVLFLKPFLGSSGEDFVLISDLITAVSRTLGEIIVGGLFVIYSLSFSILFGVATITVIESTFKEIIDTVRENLKEFGE